jgi:ParB family chromosome partitioning protein
MPKRPVDVSAAMLRPDRSQPAQERNADIGAYFSAQNVVATYLPVGSLRPNPFQPRKEFREVDLEELALSMQQLGFFGTLLARPASDGSDKYELAYGERRLRAALLAGLKELPVYLRDLTDQEMLEIAMAENVLRTDLNPLEEAQGLRDMMQLFGLSIRELAARLGKGKGYVEKRLYLLRTPADVQAMILAHPETVRSARPLAAIEDEALRAQLIAEVIAGRLASDDIEDRAAEILTGSNTHLAEYPLSPAGDRTFATEDGEFADAETFSLGDVSPTGDTSEDPANSTTLGLKRDRLSTGYRALMGFFTTRRVTYDEDTASKVRAIRDLCERYLALWEARGEH